MPRKSRTGQHTVTLKLDENDVARLDVIAEEVDRSRSWLIRKAVKNFLANTEARQQEVD